MLRAEAGDPLIVFNGEGGEFALRWNRCDRSEVAVRIGAHAAVERESPLDITLVQGIARGERMDLIVQKATELGVARVVPVADGAQQRAARCGNRARKQQHWHGVAIAACEQCGRNRIPEVEPRRSRWRRLAAGQAVRAAAGHRGDAAPTAPLLATTAPRARAIIAAGRAGRRTGRPRSCSGARVGFARAGWGRACCARETAALAVLAALQFATRGYGRD